MSTWSTAHLEAKTSLTGKIFTPVCITSCLMKALNGYKEIRNLTRRQIKTAKENR